MSTVSSLICGDELHGRGRVCFILLAAMRQPHGHEPISGIVAGRAQLFEGQLRQPAGGQRINPAADAKHESRRTGVAQALLDEALAAFDFDVDRLDTRKGGHNVEGTADFGLTAGHGVIH